MMHGGTQTICFWAFGGYNMSTGGVKAHVAASCGCKAGWFEMFPSARSTGDVRQPGRLV